MAQVDRQQVQHHRNVGTAGAMRPGRWGQSLTSHALLASLPTRRHWEFTSQSCCKTLCNAVLGMNLCGWGHAGRQQPRCNSYKSSPLPSPEDLVWLSHWVYMAAPDSPLRRESSRLASKSNTSISKISPETLLQCRHKPQNIKTKMLFLSPTQRLTNTQNPNLNTDYVPMKCECGVQSPIGTGESFKSPTIRTLPSPSIQ